MWNYVIQEIELTQNERCQNFFPRLEMWREESVLLQVRSKDNFCHARSFFLEALWRSAFFVDASSGIWGQSLCPDGNNYWQVNFPSTCYHTGLWYIHINSLLMNIFTSMSLYQICAGKQCVRVQNTHISPELLSSHSEGENSPSLLWTWWLVEALFLKYFIGLLHWDFWWSTQNLS